MKFKEQFPSLNGHTWDISLEIECKTKEILGQRKTLKGDNSGKFIKRKDVEEFTRDNKKIKEAIYTAVLGVECPNDQYLINMQEYILKELGLLE